MVGTLDAFEISAKSCSIKEIHTYENNAVHKATDSNAYIEVSVENLSDLHYSYNQKDTLEQILNKYTDDCPKYINRDTFDVDTITSRSGWGY